MKMRSLLLLVLAIPRVLAWIPWHLSRKTALRMSVSTMAEEHQADWRYYSMPLPDQLTARGASTGAQRITLTRFLSNAVKENPELRDLESLILSVQMASKTISNLIDRAGLAYNITEVRDDYSDGRFYSMKRLDQLSTNVLRNALRFTGKCQTIAPAAKVDSESPAQHQPGVLIAKAIDSNYIAVLDPLDGSGNADASICTGTVFGVFENPDHCEEDLGLAQAVLQPAKSMRAAGYCLYSSATVLVFTLGDGAGVNGFTLDPQINDFVLTHPNLTIPARGNVYSCNEANSEGWSDDWKTYLRNIKLGQGETKQCYAHRYVGSMVGDIHRTLLYGGLFAYPSDRLRHPDGNLQLLYKSAPMAFVVHNAGGKAIDGRTGSLLDVKPERVHQKSPCFMGSPMDVEELENYLQLNGA